MNSALSIKDWLGIIEMGLVHVHVCLFEPITLTVGLYPSKMNIKVSSQEGSKI